ncbi:pantothenate kinase 4-like [Tropilaelaps mercedesae]|uniref:4'-phosphopantetheine phosphatase n=1 Tax=Tropilaelaps mercedesae TaxID=418985 RepID=A0A1V9X9H8_9ACAR|nr:pantothenate kinase 4-like [Tropilaelaps mercedesae]
MDDEVVQLAPAEARSRDECPAANEPGKSAEVGERKLSDESPPSIRLPQHFDVKKTFALDVGGSLAKVVYIADTPVKQPLHKCSNAQTSPDYVDCECLQMHFAKFEAGHLDDCLRFIRQTGPPRKIYVTGGGSHMSREQITQTLRDSCEVVSVDEIECAVRGANFLLRNVPEEVFSCDYASRSFVFGQKKDVKENVFPYLLVNIGSGVSMIKVESECHSERIGGSAVGGGTFWGLGALLTGVQNFDQLLDIAERGDPNNVDVTVGDIYGDNYKNLEANLLACSFGKVSMFPHLVPRPKHRSGSAGEGSGESNASQRLPGESSQFRLNAQVLLTDVAAALLRVVAYDIAQLAVLYALTHNLKRIYFGGYFLRSRPVTIHMVSSCVYFCSKGGVEAAFFRHEGYLGAIGAFLASNEQYEKKAAPRQENHGCSSSPDSQGHIGTNKPDCALAPCSLLADVETYNPDREDLLADESAREQWLDCLYNGMDNVCAKAVHSFYGTGRDLTAKAYNAMERYLKMIEHLRKNPSEYGPLSVRSLLDMREQCLLEYGFVDPYMVEKHQESVQALQDFQGRIQFVDSIHNDKERWHELIIGLLQGKPWVVDDRNRFFEKMRQDRPYKQVAIFVDNSGYDLILGVIPFARELLKLGATVILCSNLRPVLNDVTIQELRDISEKVAKLDAVWMNASQSGKLELLDSGQGSPCLDLSRINRETAERLADCDLLVIEGMGRAIHTNFDAEFSCDSIRAAVLKTDFVARSLGGVLYSSVFKFVEVGQPQRAEQTKCKTPQRQQFEES